MTDFAEFPEPSIPKPLLGHRHQECFYWNFRLCLVFSFIISKKSSSLQLRCKFVVIHHISFWQNWPEKRRLNNVDIVMHFSLLSTCHEGQDLPWSYLSRYTICAHIGFYQCLLCILILDEICTIWWLSIVNFVVYEWRHVSTTASVQRSLNHYYH